VPINVLILGYLRYENIRRTVLSLKRLEKDVCIYISIDRAESEPSFSINNRVIDVVKQLKVQGLIEDYNILTNHRGCYRGVHDGVSWFFNMVEIGLILEDDLQIHPSTLNVYSQLAERFDVDKKLGSISFYSDFMIRGLGHINTNVVFCNSDYFSSWGWATTRARWVQFEHNVQRLSSFEMIKHGGLRGYRRWRNVKGRIMDGELDSWAYRWLFTHWIKGWRTLRPYGPGFIINSGFDQLATHTSSFRDGEKREAGELQPTKNTQEFVLVENLSRKDLEKHILEYSYGISSLKKRISERLN